MLELNKLYNMDCMEGMKEFPDKYFELAICDPPYGIGIGASVGGASRSVTVGGVNLSRPKFIGDLMTHRSPIKNILMSYSGLASTKLYGVEITSLNI